MCVYLRATAISQLVANSRRRHRVYGGQRTVWQDRDLNTLVSGGLTECSVLPPLCEMAAAIWTWGSGLGSFVKRLQSNLLARIMESCNSIMCAPNEQDSNAKDTRSWLLVWAYKEAGVKMFAVRIALKMFKVFSLFMNSWHVWDV